MCRFLSGLQAAHGSRSTPSACCTSFTASTKSTETWFEYPPSFVLHSGGRSWFLHGVQFKWLENPPLRVQLWPLNLPIVWFLNFLLSLCVASGGSISSNFVKNMKKRFVHVLPIRHWASGGSILSNCTQNRAGSDTPPLIQGGSLLHVRAGPLHMWGRH